MQRSVPSRQRRWDDIPLPELRTKAHPEPWTMKGRSGSPAAPQPECAAAVQTNAQTGAISRTLSDDLLHLELGSIMEAEPMTREEADAFDATPMDAFFQELQMFSLSNLGAGEHSSNKISAPAGSASSDAERDGPPHPSNTSYGHDLIASIGQTSYVSRGTRSFEATDSNRSSFDTVEYGGQHSMAGAAMQTSLRRDSSPHKRTPQSYFPAAHLDMWPAPGIVGQTLAPAAGGSHDRVSSTQHGQEKPAELLCTAAQRGDTTRTIAKPHLQQAAALRAFGLPQVQSTPALRQSAMQLSLGMDVSRGLNLDSWQYGREGPSMSMVLEAMDCHVSTTGSQSTMPQNSRPGNIAEAEKCQVAQLTSAMIPQPVTAFALAPPAPDAERCGSANLVDVPSVLERYNSLPRLKLEPKEDPMQQVEAPMSAPARSAGLLDLAGASPHAPCRSTEGEASQRMESLERYRDKKRRRLFSGAKTIRYEKRKVNADRRPRVKGRFVKQSEFEGMQHGEAKGEAADAARPAGFQQDERAAVRPEFWGI